MGPAQVRAAVAGRQLDDAQITALVRLTGGENFLSVLTAPAGADLAAQLGPAHGVKAVGPHLWGSRVGVWATRWATGCQPIPPSRTVR
ncbi:MAG: hypothetical protein NVS3B26_22040 [Mycobacteriales bacterium]